MTSSGPYNYPLSQAFIHMCTLCSRSEHARSPAHYVAEVSMQGALHINDVAEGR